MSRRVRCILMVVLAALFGLGAQAKPATMTVTVEGIENGQPIPAENAVCLPTPDGKSNAEGKNIRPTIRWSGAPKETDSFAIFIMDPDVPADFTDAGKEGKTIAADAKRQDFYHYAVVNLPATTAIWPGTKGDNIPDFSNELVNDMGLNKYVPSPVAYGGPCPPWNDARVHHYHFMVLALGKGAAVTTPTLRKGELSADDPNTAKNTFDRLMHGTHVLAKGTAIGTYSLNKAAKP